jgi:hypothetical protein
VLLSEEFAGRLARPPVVRFIEAFEGAAPGDDLLAAFPLTRAGHDRFDRPRPGRLETGADR